MKNFLGIEIGGSKLQLVLGDDEAGIIQRFRFEVEGAAGADGIRSHIKETISNLKSVKLHGVGVGFGGPVNRITGKIWTSYHISGWSDFPLKDWLEQLTSVKVSLDNDANVAALGEALHGAGKIYNNIFYVTLGSGVGGGSVVGKKIYHGDLPGETEIGHIRLDKSGRILQNSCSGWAVDEKIRQFVRTHSASKLARLAKGMKKGEAKILATALLEHDEDAIDILNETMDDLAFGLSHVVHLFHPEMIVLGGGLSELGEPLRKLAEQKVTHYLMDAFQPGPIIQLSSLKEDAVPVGALALTIQNS